MQVEAPPPALTLVPGIQIDPESPVLGDVVSQDTQMVLATPEWERYSFERGEGYEQAGAEVQADAVDLSCEPVAPWSRVYGELDGREEGTQVVQTRDCGFLFFGSRKREYFLESHPFVLKTDPNGKVLWERAVAFESADLGNAEPVDVVELSSGEILVVGRRDRSSPGLEPVMLGLRLSADGEVIEQVRYTEIEKVEPRAALVSSSGALYIAGARNKATTPYNEQTFHTVTKLRDLKDQAWAHTLAAGEPLGLQEAPNGDIILVGNSGDSGSCGYFSSFTSGGVKGLRSICFGLSVQALSP